MAATNGIKVTHTNGVHKVTGRNEIYSEYPPGGSQAQEKNLSRAEEVSNLLIAVQSLIIPYIARADSNSSLAISDPDPTQCAEDSTDALIDYRTPQQLEKILDFALPEEGQGKDGLLRVVGQILKYSLNSWDRGYMHKLSGSTNAIGVVSELLLSVLNVNLHVYSVSPVLTTIEIHTAKTLASLFSLPAPHYGGVTQPGGSAANLTALVIARNTLYPDTKIIGDVNHNLVMFVSADAHYSLEKAAQISGLGSSACWAVPTCPVTGAMIFTELVALISKARKEGYTPFFVCATAGTTVYGAYDPLSEIGEMCRREKLWFHIDASYGGGVIFSEKHRYKMKGSEMADSITVNPHKMMGVPVTCSFLLGRDMRTFWKANTLPAGYLFHDNDEVTPSIDRAAGTHNDNLESLTCYDLGDLTLQCGRRGDALKLALGWIYYGREGYAAKIDSAFEVAAYFASMVDEHPNLELIGPTTCLQVCFYFTPHMSCSTKNCEDLFVNGTGKSLTNGNKHYDLNHAVEHQTHARIATSRTRMIAKALVKRGFMVDYAPGERGEFFRAVVHLDTTKVTVERLVQAVVQSGKELEF